MSETIRKKIGCFSADVIHTLGLNIPIGTPIYISESNIEHIKKSHPKDFQKYSCDIESIIAYPDYVGRNHKDGSIEFTKEYCIDGDFVKVAVRVSSHNIFYVRSMYVLNPNRVKSFITKGTLKKLDK